MMTKKEELGVLRRLSLDLLSSSRTVGWTYSRRRHAQFPRRKRRRSFGRAWSKARICPDFLEKRKWDATASLKMTLFYLQRNFNNCLKTHKKTRQVEVYVFPHSPHLALKTCHFPDCGTKISGVAVYRRNYWPFPLFLPCGNVFLKVKYSDFFVYSDYSDLN